MTLIDENLRVNFPSFQTASLFLDKLFSLFYARYVMAKKKSVKKSTHTHVPTRVGLIIISVFSVLAIFIGVNLYSQNNGDQSSQTLAASTQIRCTAIKCIPGKPCRKVCSPIPQPKPVQPPPSPCKFRIPMLNLCFR
jgi:hypothetical protein